jgi:hypothetical protein
VEDSFADLLNEQVNLIYAKITDLIKAKNQILSQLKINRVFQEFVMEQLASEMNPAGRVKFNVDVATAGISNGLEGTGTPSSSAMLTKKPLQGWSCASCDKDLVNLQGRIADFHPWMRLPSRDSPERLSKSGKGFSKIL